jgi:DNA-binding IclR family transcriptional regulator
MRKKNAKKQSTGKNLPSQPNKSLKTGIDCLLALASEQNPVGSRELARKLGAEPTKINRVLGTLASLGITEQTDDKKYMPGPGMHVLSALSLNGSGLLRASLEPLYELGESTGRSVALGILWREYVCYIYHGRYDQPLEGISGHSLFEADKSSIGKILLSFKNNNELEYLFKNKLNTSEKRALKSEIKKIRQDRYSTDTEKKGSCAMAVMQKERPIAGIAVFGGIAGGIKDKDFEGILTALNKCAERIEATL